MDTRPSSQAACCLSALACLLSLAAAPASASKMMWEEYGDLVKSSETISTVGPTLFGDQVSLQHGGLGFSVTDVSLRGNSALPVALTRTFKTKTAGGAMRGTLPSNNRMDAAMGDWDIELPNIGGVFADAIGWVNPTIGRDALRCSAAAAH
jgi:hypothetical protein